MYVEDLIKIGSQNNYKKIQKMKLRSLQSVYQHYKVLETTATRQKQM